MTRSTRAIAPILALLFAAIAGVVVIRATVEPARLLVISAPTDADGSLVLVIEASEPVGYSARQPDPSTLLIELRNASSRHVVNLVPVTGPVPIGAVTVNDSVAADGTMVSTVRVSLTRPISYNVRSARNTIRVEFAPGEVGTSSRSMPPMPPMRRVSTASGPANGTAGAVGAMDAASVLSSIETEQSAEGIQIRLRGNGRMLPASVGDAGAWPPRLVLDFPNLSFRVPAVTPVNRGPIERIRVALNSRSPLMTRVVVDLTRPVDYRVVPAENGDRDLTILFVDATAPVVPAREAAAGPVGNVGNVPRDRPAASNSSSGGVIVLDAMEALNERPSPANDVPSPANDVPAVAQAAAPPQAVAVSAAAASSTASPSPVPGPNQPLNAALAAAQQALTVPPVTTLPGAAVPIAPAPAAATPAPAAATSAPAAVTQVLIPLPPAPVPQAPAPPVPAPPVPAPPVPAPQTVPGSQGDRQYTGHAVSLDFQNADLRAVLRAFAEISGLNMVIDPTVQGTVDVKLIDVPWDQALDIILRANKLGYTLDGTVVRIAPLLEIKAEATALRELAAEQALSGETRVVTRTLSYARAVAIRPLIEQTALSPRGQVRVDERTNTLIITDLQENLDAAAQLIGTLDRAEPQVEIEARVVQTNKDFLREIGVQLGVTGRVAPDLGNTTGLVFPNNGGVTGRAGGAQGPIGVDPRAGANEAAGTAVNLPASAANSAIGLALGAVNGAFNLDVALSALEREGKGRILSTPRVSTQNNVEATITQGIQIPIQTVANNTVTVTFKDAALTLRVTPQITSVNTVIMRIDLENASPDFTRSVNGIPPIDTQRAVTQVQVNDGATTVIGGIFLSREQTVNDRTPFLHRIPLIGWLFRRDRIEDSSRELLIFITPRIIRS